MKTVNNLIQIATETIQKVFVFVKQATNLQDSTHEEGLRQKIKKICRLGTFGEYIF